MQHLLHIIRHFRCCIDVDGPGGIRCCGVQRTVRGIRSYGPPTDLVSRYCGYRSVTGKEQLPHQRVRLQTFSQKRSLGRPFGRLFGRRLHLRLLLSGDDFGHFLQKIRGFTGRFLLDLRRGHSLAAHGLRDAARPLPGLSFGFKTSNLF
ncbi:hypothetical protein EYF80_013717 [Liparis tanakae]|uniref:Uncharacterized protein n=1 Tax=Liparis tanakae TaxID=230148 RepID=A0A4Z2IES4_9TELE|nr:hypothetical protein EYF80_013717 [Liparis tanakae]